MQNKNRVIDANVRKYCHFPRFACLTPGKNRWKRDE